MFYFELKSFIHHLVPGSNIFDPNLLVIIADFFPKNGKFFSLNDGSKRYFERVKYKCENYQDGIHRYIMGEDGGFSTFKDVYSYLFPGYTFKFKYFYPIQEDEDEVCPNIVIGIAKKENENENVILLCDNDCLLELMSEWEEDPGFRNCCCKKYPVFDDDKFIDDWILKFICKSAFHSKNPKEELKLLCDSENCDLFDFEREGFYEQIQNVLKKYKKDIDQLVLKILDFKT